MKINFRFNDNIEVAEIDKFSTIPIQYKNSSLKITTDGTIFENNELIQDEPISIDLKSLKSQFEIFDSFVPLSDPNYGKIRQKNTTAKSILHTKNDKRYIKHFFEHLYTYIHYLLFIELHVYY